MNYIRGLKTKYALKLVFRALKEDAKHSLFQLYLADRGNPNIKTTSFNEYLTKAGFVDFVDVKYDKRKKEDILDELKDVMELFPRKE